MTVAGPRSPCIRQTVSLVINFVSLEEASSLIICNIADFFLLNEFWAIFAKRSMIRVPYATMIAFWSICAYITINEVTVVTCAIGAFSYFSSAVVVSVFIFEKPFTYLRRALVRFYLNPKRPNNYVIR